MNPKNKKDKYWVVIRINTFLGKHLHDEQKETDKRTD